MTNLSLLVSLALAAAVQAPSPAQPVVAHRTVASSRAVWPVAAPDGQRPEIAARFAPPAEDWDAGHRGVDLVGRAADPVRAALAGTVSFAGTIAGRGVVVVDHGGTRTTYEPVAVRVKRGAGVAAGATLGTLQPGGSHCPPRSCLHLGLLAGQEYLDPLSLFGLGPVRLLPVS